MLPYNKSTNASELLIKMINNEQHQIKVAAKSIANLSRVVANYINDIETVNEVANVDVVSWPPYQEIKKT